MNTTTKNLVLINILIISLFPSLICSYLGMSDPFCYTTISFLENYKTANNIFPIQEKSILYNEFSGIEKRPLMENLLMILFKITNIPFARLQFLPLGGFILPILYLSLMKDILKEKYLLLGAVVYFGLAIAGPTSYSIYIHSWALSIYIVFILLYKKIFSTAKPEVSLLLIIVFIASNFYYYSTTVWIISLILAYTLSSKLANNSRSTISLLILSVVIFIGFNRIIYDTFLPKILKTESSPLLDSFSMLLLRVKNLGLTRNYQQDELLFLGPPNQDILISRIALLILIVITVPIFYKIIYCIYHIHNTRSSLKSLSNLSKDSNLILEIAILLTTIIDVTLYSAYGVVILRYVYLFLPIVSLVYLEPYKKISSFFIYLLIILQLSILIMSFCAGDDFVRSTTYTDLTPSSFWLFDKTHEGIRILTDFDTSGKYFVLGATDSFFFKRIYYNIELYSNIISYPNKLYIERYSDFIVIDIKSKDARIKSVGWISFKPIVYYINNVSINNDINKIYDDNISWIYKPVMCS